MGAFIRIGDVARHLLRMFGCLAKKREHRQWRIAGLFLHGRDIDAALVDARRRAGLEASDIRHQLAQARGQGIRRRIASAAALVICETDVNTPAKKSPRGQHDGARHEAQSRLCHYTSDAFAFNNEVINRLLESAEIRKFAKQTAYRLLVQHPIGLGARGTHRRTFACVQNAELDAGTVGGARHEATERIDLLDQVALADATDRRIAGHGADRLDIVREQQGLGAQTRAGRGRLGAGMAAANYDYVISFGM